MRTTQIIGEGATLEGIAATIKYVTEQISPQKREIIADSS
jgi:hypothetical protein